MARAHPWLTSWRRGLALADRLGGWPLLEIRIRAPDLPEWRDYAPGDDLRQIDWWLAARRDELLTRRPVASDDVPVCLLVDASASMASGSPGKWDMARRIAGQLACAVLQARRALRVVFFASGRFKEVPTLSVGTPIDRLARMLDASDMAPVGPDPAGDPSDVWNRLAGRHVRRGVAVLVSDFFDPQTRAGVAAMQRYGDRTRAVQVYSPEDADPDVRGPVDLVDVERGLRREAFLARSTVDRYRRAFARFLEDWRRQCLRSGVPCLQFCTSDGPQTVLKGLLSGRQTHVTDAPAAQGAAR